MRQDRICTKIHQIISTFKKIAHAYEKLEVNKQMLYEVRDIEEE